MPTGIKLVRRPPPPTRRYEVIQSSVVAEMNVLLREHVQARQVYMASWKKAQDKPKFTPSVKTTTGKILARLKLSGQAADGAKITVWELLRGGTDVRYMMVTTDWKSKTAVGRMRSGAGQGSKIGLGPPGRGIDARDQDNMINESLEDELFIRVKTGYAKGFKKLAR